MKVLIDGVEYVPVPDVPTGRGLLDALEVRFSSDAGNITVRDYLCTLLLTLWKEWKEGEGFSGKRPFGNSGWEYALYRPLIAGGFIPGKLAIEGAVDYIDEKIAGTYVRDLILAVFYSS